MATVPVLRLNCTLLLLLVSTNMPAPILVKIPGPATVPVRVSTVPEPTTSRLAPSVLLAPMVKVRLLVKESDSAERAVGFNDDRVGWIAQARVAGRLQLAGAVKLLHEDAAGKCARAREEEGPRAW